MDTRSCVEECPSTHIQHWSTTSDLMGKVCYPSSISSSIQTVFIGVVCGAVLCFAIVLVGVLMFKRKHQKLNKKSIKDQLIDEEYDRHEFIQQLDELRPHSEVFLHMLNDTRKQIRKLHVSGDNTASAKFYPIVRDLAKILILLNRPVELIDGPLTTGTDCCSGPIEYWRNTSPSRLRNSLNSFKRLRLLRSTTTTTTMMPTIDWQAAGTRRSRACSTPRQRHTRGKPSPQHCRPLSPA